MNGEALKARIRNIAKDKDVDPQSLMQLYFMDQFLLRLSLYEEKDHIIIKGGMLMVALLGISTRSTMDIDTAVKSFYLNEESALKVFTDISSIPYDDGCQFELKKIEQIMDENEYQGYRIYFTGKKEKITQSLHLDLSTGDEITPKEIDLTYRTFLLGEEVNIRSYNIETVVAEKLETVLTRGTANTRMKDYYDLYIIHKMMTDDLDQLTLIVAFENTLRNRETGYVLDVMEDIIEDIRGDEGMKSLWHGYRENYSFAKQIEFDECLVAVADLLSIMSV